MKEKTKDNERKRQVRQYASGKTDTKTGKKGSTERTETIFHEQWPPSW